MTIEQRLERVMEIGDWQGCFRTAVYNCWYDSDDPFEDPHLMSALNRSLALWMEFNEIVEELERTILGLGGVIECLVKWDDK